MGNTYSKREKQSHKQPWYNPDNGDHTRMYDRKEYSSCAKKVGAYGHEKEALAAARKIPRDDTTNWSAYKCPFCKKYHLTSNKGKKQ